MDTDLKALKPSASVSLARMMPILIVGAVIGGVVVFASVSRFNFEVRRRASLADSASGGRTCQAASDAERQGRWTSSIGQTGKWDEAVALWVRALELDPNNTHASYGLYDTLVHCPHASGNLPIQTLRLDSHVNSASFSPDGERIVTACRDKTVQIWDTKTGSTIGQPLWNDSNVSSASFSPDGSRVLSTGLYSTRLWDAATGVRLSEQLQPNRQVFRGSFSPDGTRVLTLESSVVRFWDSALEKSGGNLHHTPRSGVAESTFKTGSLFHPFGGSGVHISSVQFSPDGTQVITACGYSPSPSGDSDGYAQVWDVTTAAPLGKPLKHESGVSFACFSPDGTRVLTASWDNTARLWDPVTGEPLGEPLRHQSAVKNASFSPDGTRFLTVSDDAAWVWDTASKNPLLMPLRHDAMVLSASFSPDGNRIMTTGNDNTACVWDVATGALLGTPLRHADQVTSASFNPNGMQILTASADQTVRVWNTPTAATSSEPRRYEDHIVGTSFGRKNAKIITRATQLEFRDESRYYQVWDANTGTALGKPLKHGAYLTSADFSPNDKHVVTTCGASYRNNERVPRNDAYKFARVWDFATGETIGQPMEHHFPIRSVSFSSDGSRIVTGVGNHYIDKPHGFAQIWNANTGDLISKTHKLDATVYSAKFSPDGMRVVTACGAFDKPRGHAQVWDANTGEPLGKPLRHDSGVKMATFSPNGTRIVTASWDKTARIWNASTGEQLVKLPHEFFVHSASFSPDGARVLTSCGGEHESRRSYFQVWDASTGTPLGEQHGHDAAAMIASFSPDGDRVFTTSVDTWERDNSTRAWEIPLELKVTPAVLNWARAVAGLRFRNDGELEVIPDDERRKGLAETKLPPGPWAELATWSRTTGPDRKLSPQSKVTLRQIAERERDFGSRASLESALKYDSTVPLARLMLANVLEKGELAKKDGNSHMEPNERKPDSTVPARAAFLRRYDLDRLPNDAKLWLRAAEILRELPNALVGVAPQPITAAEAADRAAKRP